MQGVGDSVLMEVEGYQFLMARDDARHLGSALLSVVAAGGDVLDVPEGLLGEVYREAAAMNAPARVQP